MNKQSKSEFIPLDEEIVEAPTQVQIKAEESESKAWIYCSLVGAVLFGSSNYFIGDVSISPYKARLIIGVGNGFVSLLYFVIKKTYHVWTQKAHSEEVQENGDRNQSDFWYFYTKEGKINKTFVSVLVMDMLFSTLGIFAKIISFEFALFADLNQGIVPILFSFSAIFASIIAFVAFKEKNYFYHWVGMILLIL